MIGTYKQAVDFALYHEDPFGGMEFLKEYSAGKVNDSLWGFEQYCKENPDLEGWQPIETAPKDGTSIMCFALDNKSRVDHFSSKSLSFWKEYPDHKYTHWQPLPEPPKDAK